MVHINPFSSKKVRLLDVKQNSQKNSSDLEKQTSK